MQQAQARVKFDPLINDTTGFFGRSVPVTNEILNKKDHPLHEYTDFSIYDYFGPKAKPVEYKTAPSIFAHHELQVKGTQPKSYSRMEMDWVTGIIIFSLIILAWIQTNHSKRLRQIARSVALPYYINQLEREGNLYNERISLGLGYIFLTSLSFLVFKLAQLYDSLPGSVPEFVSYLLIFGAVIGFTVIKAGLIRILGSVFKTQDQAHAYRLNTLIFNQMLGLVILPFILIIYYWQSTPYIWITIGLASILLIYRFVRSILIGLGNTKFSVFHLILYLCTLEILPLLIMVKFIRQI